MKKLLSCLCATVLGVAVAAVVVHLWESARE